MLFCIAFLFQFLIAGLTGIMLSAAPFDWQLSGSYFVVAHFHYVIVGGILFCSFGAFYYWFPKMSGRMYNEALGKVHFWLFLIGFHLTFDFMHIPGLLGMPRRIYTYEPGRGWDIWNLIVTVGVFFQAAGVLVFVGNLIWSYFEGELAGSDPWDAWTLEWSTDVAAAGVQLRDDPGGQEPPSAVGPQTSRRSRLALRVRKHSMSAASVPILEPPIRWSLPSRGSGRMYCLIAAESAIFTIFVVAYIFYIGKSLSGPQPRDILRVPVFYTICLLSSSLTIHFAARLLRNGNVRSFVLWWLVTIGLGATFLTGTGMEWRHLIYDEGLTIQTNLFGTTYYSLVGLHAFHVTVGLILLGAVAIFALLGYVKQKHAERVEVLSLYWHFVDAVWVVVFTVVYVIGR